MNKNFGAKKEEVVLEGIPLVADSQDPVLPNPGLFEFYNDLKHRMFYIEDGIETMVAMELCRLIVAWNREDEGIPVEERKPIRIMIHSPGGNVVDMNTIIDTIVLSKTPVYTYNIGMAFSAGFDILVAGDKRFCFPHSEVLIHLGYFTVSGGATAVTDTTDNYKRTLKKFEEWVLTRTKIDKTLFNKKKKSEWYLDAEEQVKYGVVDKIITDLDEVLK